MKVFLIASLLISGPAFAGSAIKTETNVDLSGVKKESGKIIYSEGQSRILQLSDEGGDSKGNRQTLRANLVNRSAMTFTMDQADVAAMKISTPQQIELASKLNDCLKQAREISFEKTFPGINSCGSDIGSGVLIFPNDYDQTPLSTPEMSVLQAGGLKMAGTVHSADFMVVEALGAPSVRDQILKAITDSESLFSSKEVVNSPNFESIADESEKKIENAVKSFNKLVGIQYRVLISTTSEGSEVVGIQKVRLASPETMLGDFSQNGLSEIGLRGSFGSLR